LSRLARCFVVVVVVVVVVVDDAADVGVEWGEVVSD
jgi:hypothetical protein